MSLSLTSSAFAAGTNIPLCYTCDGANISPPLSWSGLSPECKSTVLIVDDPDAPDPAAPQRIWVHWILYNIAPEVTGLVENIEPNALPHGVLEGLNDWHETGYGGPCPPIGRHRYFCKLYALDCQLPDLKNPTRTQLEQAMQGHILEQAELIGLYQRDANRA
jgi:Raf kinase inhibitor-like YbhB/YbcL family protein